MKNKNFLLGLILFLLGMAGVFSLLAMSLDEFLTEEVRKQLNGISEDQLRWLSLINPAVLVIISVVVGVALHKKVKLGVPLINGLLEGEFASGLVVQQLKFGIGGGVLAGILILVVSAIFEPFLPQAYLELGDRFDPPLVVRFLYGGITEEILLRFGLMTLFVWIGAKIARGLSNLVFWISIVLSSIIFGIGHLPAVLQLIPEPDFSLVVYIIFANSLGGIVFGWLYWKKGLEAAMIAHILTHVTMLLGEWLS
ncbi:MAG: lysostaphin resistance A-like protein [Cytophagaceae bacterium]